MGRLAALTDKSFVITEGSGEARRYRLHEIVRQYAQEKLAERLEIFLRFDEKLMMAKSLNNLGILLRKLEGSLVNASLGYPKSEISPRSRS